MSECNLGWVECHAGTAAWVQAIGAIVALMVAIWVPVWMAKSADRLARRRLLESVAAIGAEAQECFANAAMHCGNGGEDAVKYITSVEAYHKFRVASAAMNAIPINQLPTYGLTRSVLELQRMMEEAMMQRETAFNEIGNHNGQLVQAEAYAKAFSRLGSDADIFLRSIEAAAKEQNSIWPSLRREKMLFKKRKQAAANPDNATEHLMERQIRVAKWLNGITGGAALIALAGIYFVYIGIVDEGRAWISVTPDGATWVAPNLLIKMKIADVGKEPATDITVSPTQISFADINQETADPDWPDVDTCKGISPTKHGQVVYPEAAGVREHELPITAISVPPEDWNGVLNYTKGMFIVGCIAYSTFNQVHHSQYCFFERRLPDHTTQATDCKKGAYAD